MKNSSKDIYERYCAISKTYNCNPVWFEDAFLINNVPNDKSITYKDGQLFFYSSARTNLSKVNVYGAGTLTLIVGFGVTIENMTVNIIAGDLTIFIGPYSEIKNIVIQSFDTNNLIHFGVSNTLNTANLLVQGRDKKIFFGHDCMFSTNFHARTSDSHSMFDYKTKKRINFDACIIVGDHCWLGRQVILNKGTFINDDVTIGQGSIVSGNLDSSSCYAGVPARKIKEEVTWDRDRASNIDQISDTYFYRPIQCATNKFLLENIPFHPHANLEIQEVRSRYVINKKYPWIPTT
jgi:acetyltransferase-like isoleucine patch superfamily enzyme